MYHIQLITIFFVFLLTSTVYGEYKVVNFCKSTRKLNNINNGTNLSQKINGHQPEILNLEMSAENLDNLNWLPSGMVSAHSVLSTYEEKSHFVRWEIFFFSK